MTLVEVVTVEDDVVSIQDEEVRACFENLLAAKRLIRNFSDLPAKVKEELRAAVKTEEEAVSRNIVTLVPGSSASPEPAAVVKRWP